MKKIDPQQIDMGIISEAGEVLIQGGLVAFPTETVYGLGADGLNKDAAAKIYKAKGRPSDNPLIIHVADLQSLEDITKNLPQELSELAYHFWPGPLTMIFEKSERVPYETTGGLETVAVRMPENLIARHIIEAGGGFIAAPSANLSGRPSPTSASHVAADMNGRIDMIIDGGVVEIGLESTILDMTVDPPVILRPGAVTKEMLEKILPEVAIGSVDGTDDNEAPKAPGMKYRHYAPKAPLIVVEGESDETVKAIKQLVYGQRLKNKKAGIICVNENVDHYKTGIVKTIGARGNERAIARNLYAVLREFDEEGVDYIFSEDFSGEGLGAAVRNRLLKAAGYKIISAQSITRLQRFRKIIFVGNGDTCRGPIAAKLLQEQYLEQEYEILSKGLVVLFPEPANSKAEEVMKVQGKSLEDHEASQLRDSDLEDDTLVITMEEGHKWKILAEFPQAKQVYTFHEYIGGADEVGSAYGLPLEEYEKLYDKLEKMIVKFAERLNEEVQS